MFMYLSTHDLFNQWSLDIILYSFSFLLYLNGKRNKDRLWMVCIVDMTSYWRWKAEIDHFFSLLTWYFQRKSTNIYFIHTWQNCVKFPVLTYFSYKMKINIDQLCYVHFYQYNFWNFWMFKLFSFIRMEVSYLYFNH